MSEYWTEPALRAPGQAADGRGDAAAGHGAARRPRTRSRPRRPTGRSRATRCGSRSTPRTAPRQPPTPTPSPSRTSPSACVQPQGPNLHAVFFVHPREALTFHYERGAADPRVSHELTLETDDYGNVLRSVSVGYPRRPGYPPPEPTLSAAAQAMLAYDQTRLHVRGTEHAYTNPVDDVAAWPDAYRAPLVCTVDSAEITGVAPPVQGDRDHQPVHLRRHRRARRGLVHGLDRGRRHRLRADPRLRHRRDRGSGRRADPPVRRAPSGPLPRRRPDGGARAR